ncbi:MAG: aminoglycoside phosphotransferase family protein [Pyrinomonadaceae bacterium]
MRAVASETEGFFAFDPAFPRRDDGLSVEAMGRSFGSALRTGIESCQLIRVKYRPETSLRALYRVETGDESHLLTARFFSGEGSARIYEELKTRTGVFHDQDLGAIFWKFPADRKIIHLNKISVGPRKDLKGSGNLSAGGELVAYAPEKCATFRISNRAGEAITYAKIFADKKDSERIFSIYRDLPAGKGELFPQAVCYSPACQTLLIEAVRGKRLADLEEARLSGAFRKFGALIANFHQQKRPAGLPEFFRHKPEKISRTLKMIGKTMPSHFSRAEKLARKLNRLPEIKGQEDVVLHGDVHPKNAICREDGRLILIDLDQVGFGPPAADIGSFLAGLFYKELIGDITLERRKDLFGGFLAGYETVRPLPVEKAICRHTAAAIFTERCGRAINRYRVEGLQKFASLLDLGERVLEGGVL